MSKASRFVECFEFVVFMPSIVPKRPGFGQNNRKLANFADGGLSN